MIDQRSAARRYGWYLGIIAGVFAALQVLISTTAALADAGNMLSAQQGLSDGTAVPQFLLGPLLPPVVAAYASMMLTGAIMLYLARKAGELATYVSGRRELGMVAGGWVALISAFIWIGLSMIVALRAHADGTITGLFTSNPVGRLQPVELVGLLVQEIAAALIGWGLGSLVGQLGAARASQTLARQPVRGASVQGSGQPPSPSRGGQPTDGLSPYSVWPPMAGAPTSPRQTYRDEDDPTALN
jgi:hypothetical protein